MKHLLISLTPLNIIPCLAEQLVHKGELVYIWIDQDALTGHIELFCRHAQSLDPGHGIALHTVKAGLFVDVNVPMHIMAGIQKELDKLVVERQKRLAEEKALAKAKAEVLHYSIPLNFIYPEED